MGIRRFIAFWKWGNHARTLSLAGFLFLIAGCFTEVVGVTHWIYGLLGMPFCAFVFMLEWPIAGVARRSQWTYNFYKRGALYAVIGVAYLWTWWCIAGGLMLFVGGVFYLVGAAKGETGFTHDTFSVM